MDDWLIVKGGGPSAAILPIEVVAVALVAVLTLYALMLLSAGRLAPGLRLLLPRALGPRLSLAMVLMATLPALSMALVLSGRANRQHDQWLGDSLRAEADAVARSIADGLAAGGNGSDATDPRNIAVLAGDFAAGRSRGLVVLDERGTVLLATPRDGLLPAEPIESDSPLPAMVDRRGRRAEIIGASIALANGWRVVRYVPLAALSASRRTTYEVAAGWLLASLLASSGLAFALAGSISGPLRDLDRELRRFDPEGESELPPPSPGAPREVRVLFEHLAGLGARLRDSYGRLRRSLRESERLRAELARVIESREQEIERRTEELRAVNATLDRLSRIDALTGVANRRYLMEFLDRTWRAALREQQPLSVLMIDIDRFKAYNDAYGHQQGDTCIRAVADAISQIVGRGTDLLARYGGEEFVAVLGNTPLEGGLELAEQVRAAIQRLAIPHRGASMAAVVTVSIGVTSIQPARGAKPEAALAAADRALYAAKEQGRNRVGFSTAARTGLFQSHCLPGGPAGSPS